MMFRIVTFAMLAVCASAIQPADQWAEQVRYANALLDGGDLAKAAAVYERTLESARAAGDDVRAAIALHNLGRLFDRKGHLRQAEQAHLRANEALNRASITDDKLVLRAKAGLALAYVQLGRYSKAETLIRGLLADYPAGAESDKVSLVGSFGVILAYKGRFEAAEKLLRETAELSSASADTNMQQVRAVTLANLAGVQMRLGRTADAIESYQKAIGTMEALPHMAPAALAVALADYAKAVRATGDRATADSLYRRAIDVVEARLGQAHPVLGTVLQQYAELVRESGRKSEARKLLTTANRIQQESERENLTGHTIGVGELFGGGSGRVRAPATLKKRDLQDVGRD